MRIALLLVFCAVPMLTVGQSLTNNNALLYLGSESQISVPGNFINNGTVSNNGNISVGGQWLNNDTYIEGTGTLTLSGSGDQVVNHNAQSFSRLRISGGGVKIFEADITIEDELILADGILLSDNNASIIVSTDASISGANDLSFIEGRVIHQGEGNKLFPVGFDGLYLPITLESISGSSPEIAVAVFEPNTTNSTDESLSEVSDLRFWDVELISGSLDQVVYIPDLVNETLGPIEDLVVVLAEDRNEYRSVGQSGFTGDVTLGTLTSESTSGTGYITIGLPSSEEPPNGIIEVVNAVSPNGDGLHDFLEIENIEQFPDNQVLIYDRWGGQVFSVKGYNNTSVIFEGIGNQGNSGELPNGTYFYLINKGDGSKEVSGSLLLKR